MALASTQTGIVIETEKMGGPFKGTSRELSYWDKIVLQNAHPAKLAFNVMGLMWALYYAWYQVATLTIVAALAFLIIGSAIVSVESASKFVNTTRGQMVLAMNNPVSIILDILGYSVLFYSVWNHYGVLTLCAVSTFAFSRVWAAVKAFGR